MAFRLTSYCVVAMEVAMKQTYGLISSSSNKGLYVEQSYLGVSAKNYLSERFGYHLCELKPRRLVLNAHII